MPDKRKTLDAAVEKAADDFLSKPYADVRVADIAKGAGASTATVFDAYESKEGLYQQALHRFLMERLPHLDPGPEADAPLETLLTLLAKHAKFLGSREARDAFRLIGSNYDKAPDAAHAEKRRRVEAHVALLSGLCEAAAARGEIAAGDMDETAKAITARINYETVFYGTTIRTERDPPPMKGGEAAMRAVAPFLTEAGRAAAGGWFRE